MATSCYIESDLSAARLIGDAQDQWSALPQIGEQAPDVEALRARAVQCADWIAKGNGSRKRLALAVLGVGRSSSIWLRTPSDEEPVLAASLRTAMQDWGDRVCPGHVETVDEPAGETASVQGGFFAALRRPVGRAAAAPTAAGHVVISTPLSLARLWLDDLDARGVRVEMVASLWHAMAAGWGSDQPGETGAVLLHEPGRGLTWCWTIGRGLVVGGMVADERPTEPESEGSARNESDPAERMAARLALDWLTWSAHLGASPANVTLVGESAGALAQRLAARWPELPVRLESHADPVGETVRRAAESFTLAGGISGRRCLVSLTRRPDRAVRTHYRWAAAALVLLAAAVGVLGFRMNQSAGAMRAAASAAEAEARSLVESLNDPGLMSAPNLVKTLESRVMTLRTKEPPKPPPAPKPMRDEIQRLLDILKDREGVRLTQLSLDIRQPNAIQLSVPDRRTGEEILLALQQNAGAMTWAMAGGGTDTTLRLNGNWTR